MGAVSGGGVRAGTGAFCRREVELNVFSDCVAMVNLTFIMSLGGFTKCNWTSGGMVLFGS